MLVDGFIEPGSANSIGSDRLASSRKCRRSCTSRRNYHNSYLANCWVCSPRGMQHNTALGHQLLQIRDFVPWTCRRWCADLLGSLHSKRLQSLFAIPQLLLQHLRLGTVVVCQRVHCRLLTHNSLLGSWRDLRWASTNLWNRNLWLSASRVRFLLVGVPRLVLSTTTKSLGPSPREVAGHR